MTDYEEYVYESEKYDLESDMAADSREDEEHFEESIKYTLHFDVDIDSMDILCWNQGEKYEKIKALRQKFYDLIDNAIGDELPLPDYKVTDDDSKFSYEFVR